MLAFSLELSNTGLAVSFTSLFNNYQNAPRLPAVRACALLGKPLVGCLLYALCFFAVGTANAADPPKKGKTEKDAKANETAPQAPPEYTCEAEVYFIWKSVRPGASKINPPAATAAAKSVESKAPDLHSEPRREFFTRVGEQGESQELARNRLSPKLIEVQGRALEVCKERHQDRVGCLVSKTRELGEDYAKMDFALRRSVLEAANQDCEEATGICLPPESTPIRCLLTAGAPPDVPAAAEPTPTKKSAPSSVPGADPEDPNKEQPDNPFNAPFSVQ